MNLESLQLMGLALPSPAYLFGSVIFGLAGLAAYRYGKRVGRRRIKWLAVALMLYPYAITQTWLLYAVGAALCAGILIDRA